MLPASAAWDAWLAQSRELPPDFAALPSQPDLPDPLAPTAGSRVATPAAWRARREELKALFQHWVLGHVPASPTEIYPVVQGERHEHGATVSGVQLSFGPERRAKLGLELFVPDGAGPFPVFLTQHSHRNWAQIAVRRGYLACVYNGSDGQDDTESFVAAYPDCDWSTLMRRGWAAGRCVDYLATVAAADSTRILLTGHSRNGKQALMAAAFDERISAVISTSSGAGGAMPARYFAEPHAGEGIEAMTRAFPDWFHPRLRFFVGREHKLPVDMHELVALVAPRPCLLSTGLNDGVESVWAMQQTYLAVQRVYQLLGAAEHVRLLWCAGGHEAWPALIEQYLDWYDGQCGRGPVVLPERLIYPTHPEVVLPPAAGADVDAVPGDPFADLLRLADGTLVDNSATWERKRQEIRAAVAQMLGEGPPMVRHGSGRGGEPEHVAALLGRSGAGEGLRKQPVAFGEYLSGDVYLPAGVTPDRPLPAILWLHPFSYARGYVSAYQRGEQFFRLLARAGFAVFCFDQIGFGRRIEEVEGFYRHYPSWSLLGRMVRDAQAALDALIALPYVATEQIFGVGYNLGSMVGLHLGALDRRFAGFASICGPGPFRLDTTDKGTGGLRRWSQQYALLPRLDAFVGREEQAPYDLHHLLACFAPQPLLVLSPQVDRHAPVADVIQAVQAARAVYALHGAAGALTQANPETYHHLGPEVQDVILTWLRERLPAGAVAAV